MQALKKSRGTALGVDRTVILTTTCWYVVSQPAVTALRSSLSMPSNLIDNSPGNLLQLSITVFFFLLKLISSSDDLFFPKTHKNTAEEVWIFCWRTYVQRWTIIKVHGSMITGFTGAERSCWCSSLPLDTSVANIAHAFLAYVHISVLQFTQYAISYFDDSCARSDVLHWSCNHHGSKDFYSIFGSLLI